MLSQGRRWRAAGGSARRRSRPGTQVSNLIARQHMDASTRTKNLLLAAGRPCLRSVGCQEVQLCPSDNGSRLQALPLKSPAAQRLAMWRLPSSTLQAQRRAGPARSAKAASLEREPNLQVLLHQPADSDDCCLHICELRICCTSVLFQRSRCPPTNAVSDGLVLGIMPCPDEREWTQLLLHACRGQHCCRSLRGSCRWSSSPGP